MTSIHQESDEKKLKVFPVMLSGDDLIYHSRHIQGCADFDEAVKAL